MFSSALAVRNLMENNIGRKEQSLDLSKSVTLGDMPVENDWPAISHVCIVYLDQNGLQVVFVCDARGLKVSWIIQKSDGVIVESNVILITEMNGAVYVEAVDMDISAQQLYLAFTRCKSSE